MPGPSFDLTEMLGLMDSTTSITHPKKYRFRTAVIQNEFQF
jgi:hypothetical protein